MENCQDDEKMQDVNNITVQLKKNLIEQELGKVNFGDALAMLTIRTMCVKIATPN